MKKYYYLAAFLCLLSGGCSSYIIDDESEDNSDDAVVETSELSVSVRASSTGTSDYEVSLFIFDEDKTLVYEKDGSEGDYTFSTELSKGTYYVVAMSGLNDTDYTLPSDFTYDDYIVLSDNNCASEALMAASSEVELESSTEISLKLVHKMTSVSATLKGIPEEATAVTLKIYPVSSAITFAGEYRNDSKYCTLECVKDDSEWTADTTYLLPCESEETKLTITITTDDGQATYSSIIDEAMEAGQPYHLVGNYSESDITLEGEFEIEEWQTTLEIEFTFGDEEDEEDEEETVEDVSEVPSEGDIWNGCLVFDVEEVSTGIVQFYIISPEEITDYSYNCEYYLSVYEYNDWDEWDVFTKDEAVLFRDFVNDYGFDELNEVLEAAGSTTLADSSGKRYLCEDCEYSFSLHTTTISAVGTKTKYILRPVKLITASVE